MTDVFSKSYRNIEGPADSGFNLAANTANTLTQPTRALYVGVTGNVSVRMFRSQSNVLFQAVPAGTILPIRVDIVYDTTSTANGFVGLY